MPTFSNVVHVAVHEALQRPDGSSVAERDSSWFVRAPTRVATGEPLGSSGSWTLGAPHWLAPDGATDPIVRALLRSYARDSEQARLSAPHDLNSVVPRTISWRRLELAEASAKPHERGYCISILENGALEMVGAGFEIVPVDLAEAPPHSLLEPVPSTSPAPVAPGPSAGERLLELLKAYGAGQSTDEAVLRGLASHPTWLAPLWLFVDGSTTSVAHPMVLFGQETKMPPNVLWLFSDRAHADAANAQLVAQGGQLGPYVADAPGAEVFSRMAQAAFQKLNVNIGSPAQETFFVGDSPGPLLALWGRALTVEEHLIRTQDTDQLLALLARYDGLCAFEGEGGLLTVEHEGVTGVPVFSAVDCATAFHQAMSPQTRASVSRVTPSGEGIIAHARSRGIAWLFVNPHGPGPARGVPLS